MGWITLTDAISFNFSTGVGHSTHPDLLLFTSITGLHDPHQMRMLSLLLGLGTTTSRACHINAILGHDGETWESGLGDLILLRRLLGDLVTSSSSRRRCHAHAERTVSGISEIRRGRAGSVHGWAEGGLGFGRALLECGEDIVCLDQCAGIEIDGGMVVEVNGDLGKLPVQELMIIHKRWEIPGLTLAWKHCPKRRHRPIAQALGIQAQE